MTLENIKEIILKYSSKFILRGQQSYQLTKNKLLLKEINKNYNNIFSSVQEIIYLIENMNNLEKLNIFCRCGNKNTFIRYKIGYRKHCCYKCSNTDPQVLKQNKENVKLAWSKKSKDEKDIISQKMLNSKNRRTLEEKRQTFERQSNATKRMWNNFTKQDIVALGQKISFAHSMRSNEQKRKSVEKQQATMNLKSPEEKKEILNKISRKLRSRSREELDRTYKKSLESKAKNGNLPWDNKFRNSVREGHKRRTKEQKLLTQMKINDTKRKNNSFHTSKPENKGYLKLLTKFADAIHHYTDPRYPFECDFYIPSQDLFIELNFHWTHGDEPFNKDNFKHLNVLQKWKDKNSKFYKNAIYCWTDLDVRKLETFKKNNLNYKIFYTEKEFNEWFKTI